MQLLLSMLDDIHVNLLPAGYDAYAGYVDGRYENFDAVKAKFPDALILSIDVNATNTAAECLDVEPGDATNALAVQWVLAKIRAKALLIALYTSVSNMDALVAAMTAAGIPRTAYKLWSAHYGYGAHICGPGTCGLTKWACDGTQFTDTAFGDSLDESLLQIDFFGVLPPPSAYPTLAPGDTGTAVQALQTLLNIWDAKIKVDGDFGTVTETSVKAFQTQAKIAVDGVVGPITWTRLLTPPPPPPAPSPAPYPAPLHSGEDFTRYPLRWDAVVVAGKPVQHYNVKVVQTNGKVVTNATVSGTSVVLAGLTPTWHYRVYVGALGGQVTPQYATIEVIA